MDEDFLDGFIEGALIFSSGWTLLFIAVVVLVLWACGLIQI